MQTLPRKKNDDCGIVLLLCGGSGKRMAGAVRDKILESIGGVPALLRSVRAFQKSGVDEKFLFVCRDERQEREIFSLLAAENFTEKFFFCRGGNERRDSVLNGLRAARERVSAGTLAFIHDSARPLVSSEMLKNLADAGRRFGAAVPAHRCTNTIKRVPAGTLPGAPCLQEDLDRSRLWETETPQVFLLEKILAAYEKLATENLEATDDVSAFSRLPGGEVAIVENVFPNPKITVPADLVFCEALLAHPELFPGKKNPLGDGGKSE